MKQAAAAPTAVCVSAEAAAAAATASTTSAFPRSRVRAVVTATATTASDPSELPPIATMRGRSPRCACARGTAVPSKLPWTLIAAAIPTASPA